MNPVVSDPLIVGLVKRLPPAGAVWPDSERERWLAAAAAVLSLIYDDPPEVGRRDATLNSAADALEGRDG